MLKSIGIIIGVVFSISLPSQSNNHAVLISGELATTGAKSNWLTLYVFRLIFL